MYSITDVLLVQLFAVIVIYNSPGLVKYFTSLKRTLPFLNMNLSKLIKELNNFYFFICKINPLILDLDLDCDNDELIENSNEEERKYEKHEDLVKEIIFENKYLMDLIIYNSMIVLVLPPTNIFKIKSMKNHKNP
jgi:hypothetical protein